MKKQIAERKRFDDECDVINQPIMYLMSIGYCIIKITADDENYRFEMMRRYIPSASISTNKKRYYADFICWSEGGELIIYKNDDK